MRFADEGLKILSQERIETGLIVTLKKDKVKRRALQFIAQNDIGTISNPAHWLDSKISGDHLTFDVDLDISQTDGGVYIQIQTEKVIDKKISLRIKGDLQYKTIPINQIQPSVFLSAPLQPKEFESINQIEAILGESIQRQVQYKFPFTVIYPDSSISIISEDGTCSIRTKKGSFSDNTLSWIVPVHKYPKIIGGKLLSRVYQVQPFQKPIIEPIQVAIRYAKKLDKRNKHLYYYDKKEGWTFIKTKDNKERRVIIGEMNHLDAIAVIEDTSPPILLNSYPGRNGRYAQLSLEHFKINIDDQLSGFEPVPNSFELQLNGEKIIYAFQPKLKSLSYTLEEPLSIGNHLLSIKATDQAGNTLEKEIKFEVY